MSDHFKVGDAVQTRDGREAKIIYDALRPLGPGPYRLVVILLNHRVYEYTQEGKWIGPDGLVRSADTPHGNDLVCAPVKHTVWIKLRRGDGGAYPETWPVNPVRPLAPDVIACVRVEIEEGQFDE